MTFDDLIDFLENKMSMSHIYQPLLIKLLVDSGGLASVRQLAVKFLEYDESQILHYEKTLKSMPIKVLSKHGIISKERDVVSLNVQKLSFEQKATIRMVCENKMQSYVSKKGMSLWDYRLLDTQHIPGSLYYRVLKESGGRCALCGASKKERPLDVDHIIPRSRGGKTAYENLQVLCYKCNRSKGNRDDTDLRQAGVDKYDEKCPFCEAIKSEECIQSNDSAITIYDIYPVTKGHTLVIPKVHITEYLHLSEAEVVDIHRLVKSTIKDLMENDKKIIGFNVGLNNGQVAGQTIDHLHFHVIPRRKGDIDNPIGGVRGVIPGKMNYKEGG